MPTPAEEIKNKIDIVDFIKSYITLRPAGRNFKANCPFHKETAPSFIVSPDKQIWHCFGCNKGGDVIKFLMEHDNLEFHEALGILAEKAGIELKRINPAEQKQIGVLYDISEKAKEFFKKNLGTSPEAMKYLKDRGLKDKTIEEFEIGLASNNFDELTKHLMGLGYNVNDIERSGLSAKSRGGTYVDKFRGRLIFPIYNHFGKVVAFGGRILPWADSTGELAKYINSSDSLIYNKSRILYGFHKTKSHIKDSGFAVLVEGYMDLLMSYQDGVKNVVAVSGTALTPDQLRALRRYTDQLVFCFDTDSAGLNAAERSIDLALSGDFDIKILVLKDFKDPAEMVFGSPGVLVKAVKDAKPIMEFYLDYYKLSDFNSVSGAEVPNFKKILRSLLTKIKNLTSAVEKSFWLKQLSKRFNIDENSLIEELDKIKTDKEDKKEGIIEKPSFSRCELISQRLIVLALINKSFQSEIENIFEFLSKDYQKVFNNLINKQTLENKQQEDLAKYILLVSSVGLEKLDEEKTKDEFASLVTEIKLDFFKGKRGAMAQAIKEAEKSGDEEKLKTVLSQFDEISKKIQNR
ncbi:MAG: DNA primase [Candidatus Paceibacterota bacterium]|jgi:DNA primase